MSEKKSFSQRCSFPPMRYWWCDCGSAEIDPEKHDPSCHGNDEMFPRTMAALAARDAT